MNAPIFDQLAEHVSHAIAGDWQRALNHLNHHSDTIAPSSTPAQGDDMGLADDTAALKSKLQDAVGVLTDALNTDVTNLESLGDVVGNDPLIAAVENAANLSAGVRQHLAAYIADLDADLAPVAPPAPVAPVAPPADQPVA